MVVVLSGGAGGGRFCRGVVRARPAPEVLVVCNSGDDLEIYGVRVCPDLDLVTFTLAGALDRERGYGLAGDTREIVAEFRRLGLDAWFDLGDRDFALCAARTELLRAGVPLDEIAARIARAYGVEARLVPMTNTPVWTAIDTDEEGRMHFQEWWVRTRAALPPRHVEIVGVENAVPAPGVLEAIAQAEAVLIAPSNPVVSIGPILAVPGIREALARTSAPIVATTPIVEGAVFRGMADTLLDAAGIEVSAFGVAGMYADLVDGFLLDERDAADRGRIEGLGLRVGLADTVMRDDDATTRIATDALTLAAEIAKGRA